MSEGFQGKKPTTQVNEELTAAFTSPECCLLTRHTQRHTCYVARTLNANYSFYFKIKHLKEELKKKGSDLL